MIYAIKAAISDPDAPAFAFKAQKTETELNFKFYRLATNKIVGISQGAAEYLDGKCRA